MRGGGGSDPHPGVRTAAGKGAMGDTGKGAIGDTGEIGTLLSCAGNIAKNMCAEVRKEATAVEARKGDFEAEALCALDMAGVFLAAAAPDDSKTTLKIIAMMHNGPTKGTIGKKRMDWALGVVQGALDKVLSKRRRPGTVSSRAVATPPRTPQPTGANAGKKTTWAAQTMAKLPKAASLGKKTGVKRVQGYRLCAVDEGLGIEGIVVYKVIRDGGQEKAGPLVGYVFKDKPYIRESVKSQIFRIAKENGVEVGEILEGFASDQVKGWFSADDVQEMNEQLEARRRSDDSWA